jgi:hypothetical protein
MTFLMSVTRLNIRNLIYLLYTDTLLGRSSQGEWGGRGLWHAWEVRESVQGFVGKVRRKETTQKTEA